MILEDFLTTYCPECESNNAEWRYVGAYMQSSPAFVLYCTYCKRRVRCVAPEQVAEALTSEALRRMQKPGVK